MAAVTEVTDSVVPTGRGVCVDTVVVDCSLQVTVLVAAVAVAVEVDSVEPVSVPAAESVVTGTVDSVEQVTVLAAVAVVTVAIKSRLRRASHRAVGTCHRAGGRSSPC